MNEDKTIKMDLKKLHSYDFIFHNIVLPLAEELEKDVDDDFKKECSFETLDTEKIYSKSHILFRKKRETIKNIFYGDVFLEKGIYSEENYMLDLHKIASIICATLIRNKIFWYDEQKAQQYISKNNFSTEWKVKNLLINYKLAFHSSIALIYYKMLFDIAESENDNEKKMYNKIEHQGGLFLYPLNSSHESFENSVILDFAKRDIAHRSFDYLLYSTLLYQLEEYNREKFNSL